jgi:hypothetical protein
MMVPRSPFRRAPHLAAAGLTLTLLLSGCGSGSDDSGTFATGDESAYPLACMEHQSENPGSQYTGGENATTVLVLKMLRYYTANRTVAGFCDGKPPSGTDKAWAQLYVDLGSEPSHVARLLG